MQKRNTKQIILNEAFNLCYESPKSIFSLSELAQRVGISKTAIFRHFKNKEMLLDQMTSIILDGISEIVKRGDYFKDASTHLTENYDLFKNFVSEIVCFFSNNKGYLEFALNSKSFMPSPGGLLFNGLSERGVVFSKEFMQARTPERFFRVYFCGETIIYFISRKDCLEKNDAFEFQNVNDFVNCIVDLLWNGIGTDEFLSNDVRRKELDKLCQVNFENSPEDTRFFTAFAEIFQENGIEGITVERISEKLNLAKSSLYAFFENKDEFVTKMLVEEFSMIMRIIVEKTKYAKSVQELAYILLRSEKNYLEKRPYVLTIHYWASQKGYNTFMFKGKEEEFSGNRFSYLDEQNINLNGKFSIPSFIGWVSSLIGALKIFFEMTSLKQLECNRDYALELYKLIVNGIGEKK